MEETDQELMIKVNHCRGELTDLAQSLPQLLFSDLYSDVKVVCQDRNYDCHKVSPALYPQQPTNYQLPFRLSSQCNVLNLEEY